MKRKIFLIIIVLTSLVIRSLGQTVTLSGSVAPFPQNIYNPGDIVTVHINCVVNGGTADSVQIVCDLPSSVSYLEGGTLGTDPSNNMPAVFFLFPSISATGNASGIGVQFEVQFPIETNCVNAVAAFSPTFSAIGLTSFQAPTVSISSNAAYGTTSWGINEAYYRLSSINNFNTYQQWYALTSAPTQSFPFYYNSGCDNCNDSFYLPMFWSCAGQKDIENATLSLNINQSAGAVQVIDYVSKIPLTYTSTGPNSATYSYHPNNHPDDSVGYNMREVDFEYFKYLEFIVNPSLFNGTPICVSPVLTGTNCDGTPYNQTLAQQCFSVISTPAQIVFADGAPQEMGIGCDYSVNYSLTSDNTCNGTCPQAVNNATVEFNPLPTSIHVNSITVPDVTGTDTAILTGHYYCTDTHTSYSFSYSYNAEYLEADESRDQVSLGQLVSSGCNLSNSYITDYKIATSITSNTAVPLGEVNFTVLPYEWNDTTSLVTFYNSPEFTAKYNPQLTNDTTATSTFTVPVQTYAGIYIYALNICNQQTTYCIGDTVDYSMNFQNIGYANLYKGQFQATLPVGFQYIPGSASFNSYLTGNYSTCLCQSCGGGSYVGTPQPFSADFSGNPPTGTPLTWTIPEIDHSCETNNAPVYNLTFKAVITNNAVFQVGGNPTLTNILDSNSNSVYYGGNPTSNVVLCQPQAVLSSSEQVSLDGINWVQDTTVVAGQKVYYKIVLKNNGNVTLTQIKLVDILPAINDPSVSNCDTPRNSTAFVSLIDTLSEPSGINIPVLYSLSPSPTRANILGSVGPPPSCESGIFQSFQSIGSSIQNVRAFEINYGSAVLLSGDSNVYVYAALVPIGPNDSTIANNSFAAVATVTGSNTVLTGPESKNVSITVVKSTCQCVTGTIWIDSIQNNIQDPQEPGINGILVSIFDSATNTLKGTAITTYATDTTMGHYEFCNLPQGSYYVIASIPDSLINPPKPDSTGLTISDTAIVKQQTPSFTLSCSNTNTQNQNIIIVPTTNCDDDCSKRKPILFKQLQ